MSHSFGTLLPAQPRRERIFSMRLSDDEHGVFETLATQLNVSDSVLARYFVMEAVYFHREHTTETHIESIKK